VPRGKGTTEVEAHKEGAARPEHYRIEVADERLDFRDFQVDDPKPLGRQILAAAGAAPVEEFSLFAILPGGDFEDVRLHEAFDLRGRGAERFVMFRTDRDFKFEIDGRHLSWGKPVISGIVLRRLADVQSGYDLYLEVRGGQDVKVLDDSVVRLDASGIERFLTVIKDTTEGRSALPASDVTFLADNGIAYELVGEAGQPGVVLREFPLPAGRYNRERADILVLLPPGYPDACPDMFYAAPWICFPDGRSPLNADVEHVFAGRRWQRWSRHSQEWRPGIDGLRTMVARIRHALEVSK
jgi:hypothetical protein